MKECRFQEMVPNALFAALIRAATSSIDPSSEPRSLIDFQELSFLLTVIYWVLDLLSCRFLQ